MLINLNYDSNTFKAECPSRFLFEQLCDKWSMMVLISIEDQPLRFNAIKRRLEGITQKALTSCLRKLERNGLLTRSVITESPIAVEYGITSLGRSLKAYFEPLYNWTVEFYPEVERAQKLFDERSEAREEVMADFA
jgi:DNA-binding HxlR family transcriptional regulator